MHITVHFYGVLRHIVGADHRTIDVVSAPEDVGQLRALLGSTLPAIAPTLGATAVVVGDEVVPDSTPLTLPIEVALLPPVSGG